MNIKRYRKVLEEFHNNAELTYWLYKGTLIGAIRDGALIPWDNDIDVAVLASELSKQSHTYPSKQNEIYFVNGHYGIRDIKTGEHYICMLPQVITKSSIDWVEFIPPLTYLQFALIAPNYMYKDYNYIDTPLKRVSMPSLLKKFLLKITFSMHQSTRKNISAFIWQIQTRFHLYKTLKTFPTKQIIPLKYSKIYDTEYPVPNDSEAFLTKMFGADWRIPKHKGKIVKKWHNKVIGDV